MFFIITLDKAICKCKLAFTFHGQAWRRTLMNKPWAADCVVFAFFVLGPLVEWHWVWPRLFRAPAAGLRGARTAYYRGTLAFEWIPTLYVLALWAVFGRPWESLYLGRSS